MNSTSDDLKSLLKFLITYHSKKTKRLAVQFEHFKNSTVEIFMLKRGRFQKHIFHTSMLGLATVGILTSGVFGGQSLIASSFPGVGGQDPRLIQTFDPFASGISLESFVNFQTSISSKPRSEVIEYGVKSGETLSQIASKFDVSVETIQWENKLSSIHSIKPGLVLKILPVSGVSHVVKSGDSLESIAKKYSASDQAILDYPFNDIPDDFKLKIGMVVIVPDGVPPEVKAPPKPRLQPQFLALGPSSQSFQAPGGGNFIWPTVSTLLSQYFAWYHPGIDLANRVAPPVYASDGGTVTVAGWPDNYGYGNRVIVDHDNGYTSLYAHLSNIYVTTGQTVSRGQVIGQMGSTGRSTGTHLHFEIHYKGIAVNPLAILK